MTETRILTFGQTSASGSGLIRAELDEEMHPDGGSVFAPGTVVYFLLHLQGLRVVSLKSTAGGLVEKLGIVTRSATQELLFNRSGESQELDHVPDLLPAASWYGRSAGLVWTPDSQLVTVADGPVLGLFSYQYSALSYRFTPPVMSLSGDEEFPVELVIETEES